MGSAPHGPSVQDSYVPLTVRLHVRPVDLTSTTRLLQINALMRDLMASGGGAIPAAEAAQIRRQLDVIEAQPAPQRPLLINGGGLVDVYG